MIGKGRRSVMQSMAGRAETGGCPVRLSSRGWVRSQKRGEGVDVVMKREDGGQVSAERAKDAGKGSGGGVWRGRQVPRGRREG